MRRIATVFVFLAGTMLLPGGPSWADEATVVHFRFEGPSDQEQLTVQDARFQGASPGPLTEPAALPNAGSLEFDGRKAIVSTKLPGDVEELQHGFTWEGFFLAPASNTYETDGAIADRFLSQFVDASGGSTRLTVGLSILKKDGPPLLCIAFAGDKTRHAGRFEVTPDVWHHFAVVHEGTGTKGKLTWYLDYQKAGEVVLDGKSALTTMKAPGPAPLTIGARLRKGNAVDRGFTGLLDEIRLSGRPLKPEEFLRVKTPTYERNVAVQLYEDLPAAFDWDFSRLQPVETLPMEFQGFVGLPQKYSERGYEVQRQAPAALRSQQTLTLPKGTYRFLLRSGTPALLTVDGKPLIDARSADLKHPLEPLPPGLQDWTARFESDGKPHEFTLAAVYEADAPAEFSDVIVCHAQEGDHPWMWLGGNGDVGVSSAGWMGYRGRMKQHFELSADERRQAALARGGEMWKARHEQAREQAAAWMVEPPQEPGHPIDVLIQRQLDERAATPAPLVDDATLFRRLSLDIRGRIPTLDELQAFMQDQRAGRIERAIDDMLASDEWADGWVGYWQDVLAENPSILKPTLNNSGPFRRWIYDSLRHNHPLDRFATELIMMEGGNEVGGTAGFAVATQNDAPMAMKAHVLMKAFAAVDMQCARCHDSPNSFLEQRDVFSLAALLNEGPIKLPKSSIITVPEGSRQPLVSTSLTAGEMIPPAWTLEDLIPSVAAAEGKNASHSTRAQFAEILTSPASSRFSDVLVNRVWKRYLGRALVEPVENWSDAGEAVHPELLAYLSSRFVADGYDLKALARLIFTSRAYRRQVVHSGEDGAEPEEPYFAGPTRRRLTAEQLVDSLYRAVGKDFDAEEQTFDPNRTRGFLNLGTPQRAWEFTSLSNERDRPALSMPVNQAIIDVLQTFGWRETRPDPLTERDESPNPLQPLMLANSLTSSRVVRLTEDSRITELALEAGSVDELIDDLFLNTFSRPPDSDERAAFAELLETGFDDRLTGLPKPKIEKKQRARVDWDKHLKAEASVELMEAERIVREGDPPTVRLTADYRQRLEDALWALLCSPEFLFVP